MKSLLNNTYKIRDYSIKNLQSLGFVFNKSTSRDGKKCYSVRFPAVRYNDSACITGEITINTSDGIAALDVYDLKGGHYAAFYSDECGNDEDILKIINRSFAWQMKKYKIKKVKKGGQAENE